MTKIQAREKLYYSGVKSLSNAELLAIILGSGQQNCPALKLAQKIWRQAPLALFHEILSLNQNNKEQNLLQDLAQIKGVALIKASKILAAIELGRRSLENHSGQQISSAKQVFDLCADIRARQQEYCLCFFLNSQQELLLRKVITIGGLNFNYLEGREIFEIALQLKAHKLILVHNHPSNNVEPSPEDLIISQKLAELATTLGISLIDHVIVSAQHYYSIRQQFGELQNLDVALSADH